MISVSHQSSLHGNLWITAFICVPSISVFLFLELITTVLRPNLKLKLIKLTSETFFGFLYFIHTDKYAQVFLTYIKLTLPITNEISKLFDWVVVAIEQTRVFSLKSPASPCHSPRDSSTPWHRVRHAQSCLYLWPGWSRAASYCWRLPQPLP